MKAAARYIPPRPNLGPEPWPEAHAPSWWWIVGLAAIALVVAVLWARRRRVRPPGLAQAPGAEGDPDDPRRLLIARAEAVRDGLIARFGPSWASRTTEEIATDPALAEQVGPEWAAPLVELLRLADLAKFADPQDRWETSPGGTGGLPTSVRSPVQTLVGKPPVPPGGEKFADEPTSPVQGDAWGGWAVAFLASLAATPPQSSHAITRVAAKA